MLLSDDGLRHFHTKGYALASPGLGAPAARSLLRRVQSVESRPGSDVFETDGQTLRARHGLHLDDTYLRDLARQADLLSTVQKLLGADVYIYQFKVNIKAAFTGAPWPWHDDYSFWHLEDGMPGPYALTVAVFLDEVTDLNGPMMLVPGSHLEHEFGTLRADATGAWEENVSVDLRYQSPRSRVTDLAGRYGVKSCVGTPGSVLFFDCRILHASAGNISPFARRIAFITYNRVDNVPSRFDRPEFLVARTHAALSPSDLLSMDSSSD